MSRFIGIDALKQEHSNQVTQFERWANKNDWQSFHRSHYDWWAFPIDEKSSRGLMYTITPKVAKKLIGDAEFITTFRKGITLLLLAWGWDVENKAVVDKASKGQAWANWPVRLYKAGKSTILFEQLDLFESLLQFAKHLESQQHSLTFHSSNTKQNEHVIQRWLTFLPQSE